ncbi:uncharacterized protein SCHCODRAFT_02742563 [Schizophyllum commune H4-8]|uniref:Uncharacterized protein n=1 Tax=Schizophyllum commune (strain H4-8 / FGSC 9210) TaxID=578458 RepID=D8PT07_SCHCM|nr:uncharacterized protein SCHCODRAFT_02742563 [Schizophyllum commune H4-8]KAI5899478.1 hypothetical protein SCHCODRAFT_02742563 [Schizophyllum commune H4-8]
MVKTEALKTRASQLAAAKKKPYTRSQKRVAEDQISYSIKRATSTSATRCATTNQGSSSRRGKERLTAERTEPDLSGPGVPPNLDALASTLGHMYATVNGTLAPGQEPAKYSSVYQHLPKHLRIEEGTVIPQIPLLTSWGGEVVNCCYSEELANELLKVEYGSVEKGKKAVKEFMEVAEYLGGQPDPEDTTIDRIELPGLSFHLRLWLGHQKNFVSFDFCDNETKRPVEKHRFLTVFYMRSPQDMHPVQVQSLEYCHHLDQSVGYNSFAVLEGSILDVRWKGKSIKRVVMPERERPAQQAQAVPARGLRELEVKSPQEMMADLAEFARKAMNQA